MQITLSDNLPIEVRRLGIFELDNLLFEPYPPYTYKIDVLGKEVEVEFNINSYAEPPKYTEKVPETDPNYDAYWDYTMYEGALLHEEKRIAHIEKFNEKIAHYILKHCIDEPERIVDPEDWFKVYEAALVPQLTIEIIAQTLQSTYRAQFKGIDVLEAMNQTKKGHGSYDQIKLWENKLMIEMKMTELEYSLLPLEERARKVCAMFLQDVMSYLEIEEDRKENKKNG